MSEERENVDWTGVDVEMAREIKAQGETFMQSQLAAAIAADQRATTMGSILATVAAAIAAGSIAYWDKTASTDALAVGVATGLWLMLGAYFCLWAARPIDFYYPGNHPAQWFPGRHSGVAEMLGGEAENYQERITYNDGQLALNQNALKRGAQIALVSPVIALIVWRIAEAI